MTILTKLPPIGEAARWRWCCWCLTRTEHDDEGKCKTCGKYTVKTPREGENGKHTR